MPYCTMMPACCGDREGRCGSPNCKPSVSNTTTAVSTQMRSGRFLRIHQPPSQSSQYRARRFCYCPPALSSHRNPEPERQGSPRRPLTVKSRDGPDTPGRPDYPSPPKSGTRGGSAQSVAPRAYRSAPACQPKCARKRRHDCGSGRE